MALRQAAMRGSALLRSPLWAAASAGAVPSFGPAPWLARSYADDSNLKRTVLYDLHVAHGGKMVPFAGWSMPIQYKDSIIDSTLHCRNAASVFDVSHMCGLSLKGKDAIPFIEKLVVGDIAGMAPGTGGLSVITNETGGIIDDTVITKVSDSHLYVVVNAGCRDKDLAHLNAHLGSFKASGGDVALELHDDRSLLAVQGPKAAAAVQALTSVDLSKVYFSDFLTLELAGIPVWATRTGYTGEDGFEISVPNASAEALASKLLENPDVKLAGLGPRDSLRLEAGLCLYGNDIDETISPIEAGLAWTVAKRRRAEGGFLGAEAILKQIADGVSRKRVGLFSEGAPARQHSKILDKEGNEVGEVTSGAFSPTLKRNVAMGYVTTPLAKSGTELLVEVRGKRSPGSVTKMPFAPTHYVTRPKK